MKKEIILIILIINIVIPLCFNASSVAANPKKRITGNWCVVEYTEEVFENYVPIEISFWSLGKFTGYLSDAYNSTNEPVKIGGFFLSIEGDPGSPYVKDYSPDEFPQPYEKKSIPELEVTEKWDYKGKIEVHLEIYPHTKYLENASVHFPSETFDFEITVKKEVTPREALLWSIFLFAPVTFVFLTLKLQNYLNTYFFENVTLMTLPKYSWLRIKELLKFRKKGHRQNER